MKALYIVLAAAAALVLGGAILAYALYVPMPDAAQCAEIDRLAVISPDYAGLVIPPNIAPLNFIVKEDGKAFAGRLSGARGEALSVADADGRIVFPAKAWRALLEANRGGEVTLDVYVMAKDGWQHFRSAVNTVADVDIDRYLVYREMPIYNLSWADMGIYQRDLESFDVRTILHNSSYQRGCANCHTFLNNKPDRMLMHVRSPGKNGPPGGTVLAVDGKVEAVINTTTEFNPIPAIYIAWHPSGKIASFSTNKVHQCFHTTGKSRDGVDEYSDMAMYIIATNTVTTIPELARADYMETYPAWTPDGRTFYYCRAPQLPISRYREIKYDLMRMPYDIDTNTWGKPETVISAADTGLSAAIPRISPDGKWLMFNMSNYGTFPAYSPSADLYMMDLATGKFRKMDVNSDQTDGYHTWASSSRWAVFSSKRSEGLLARPWITYIDENGRGSKPFILPQEDPAFYDSYIRVFNVPELIAEPIPVTERQFAEALYSKDKAVKAKLDPAVVPHKRDADQGGYQSHPGQIQ